MKNKKQLTESLDPNLENKILELIQKKKISKSQLLSELIINYQENQDIKFNFGLKKWKSVGFYLDKAAYDKLNELAKRHKKRKSTIIKHLIDLEVQKEKGE